MECRLVSINDYDRVDSTPNAIFIFTNKVIKISFEFKQTTWILLLSSQLLKTFE